MPLLKKRWPHVSATLSRVASHCADAQSFLEFETEQHLPTLQGSKPHTLSVKKLLALTTSMRKHILRAWIFKQDFPLPSALKLQHIEKNVLLAAADKTPLITWHNTEVRRYGDDIYIHHPAPPLNLNDSYEWNSISPLMLPGVGTLCLQNSDVHFNFVVRFRQGGEKFQLAGRQSHHTLKHLMQMWRIPPWERNQIPLIFLNEKLIGVPGFYIDPIIKKNADTQFVLEKNKADRNPL